MMRMMTMVALLIATGVMAGGQPAPQPPDPAFLQAAVGAVRAQRDAAMDAQAVAEARIVGLNDQVAKLQARIAEMEKKPAEPKDGK